MSALVAVPSRGRLRDAALALLEHAGYRSQPAHEHAITFLEMRPADAAAWLAAGRLAGAFLSTDTAMEQSIDSWPSMPLATAQSDLVVACRREAEYDRLEDLEGLTVASHLPGVSARLFAARQTSVSVMPMGGALEGVCRAGLADAIVDLCETGASLARNDLRILETVCSCQGLFVQHPDLGHDLVDLVVRLGAALAAKGRRYLLAHLPPERIDELTTLFPGLASPTVLPLAGRDDLVAVHMVVEEPTLWARLSDLRRIGATGIVAMPTDAILT